MPRNYDVRTAAFAVGMSVKELDNFLSHHSVVGVSQGTRGVSRQLNDDALLSLALCRILITQLGMPRATAARVANDVVTRRASTLEVAPGCSLQLSLDVIERSLRSRLHDATEMVARVRRGRPPQAPAA